MSLDDRLREELRGEGSRLAPGLGDVAEVMRRGRRRRALQRTAAGVVVALTMAGPLALLQSRGSQPGPVVTEPSPTTTTTSSTSTTASTAPDPDAGVPGVIVSGPEGIAILSDGEAIDRVDVGPIMLATGDHEGGYVVQVGVSASSIMRLPAGASQMTELIAPQPGETLTLHETALIEGSPTVVYTVRATGVDPVDSRDELHLFSLDTGEDRVVGYESGTVRVSYADGTFLLSMTSEGVTWFQFMDTEGRRIDMARNPRTEEAARSDFLVWTGQGDQAPDGQTMAFLRGSPRSEAPFDVVVVDLGTGETISGVPLDRARHDNVTRIEWDGQVAVVSFTDGPPVVVATDGTVTDLGTEGTAVLTP